MMLVMNPQLTGTVVVESCLDRLEGRLAEALRAAAIEAEHQRGVFHLALSGGSTPRRFYERLATPPIADEVPWSKTHLWVVDERRVPASDDRSNIRMIRESLANQVSIPTAWVHPVPVLEEDPATRYEHQLSHIFGLQPPAGGSGPAIIPRLDFVLLGMGDDGHTASLFPHSSALDVADRWVVVNDGPEVTPPPRVTMTFPLLNAARQIAILVTGNKKSATLKRVDQQIQEQGPDVPALPITGIYPHSGELTWYLDAAAVGIKVSDGDTTHSPRVCIQKIVSGGQTGADRAALDVALELGIDYGGWVPKERLAEDGTIDPRRYPNLTETESDGYLHRTELNVRDSDATVIFSHGPLTGGSAYTRDHAKKIMKPWLHIDLQAASEDQAIQQVRDWTASHRVNTLNVAGPRASGDPRIYAGVKQCLTRWLSDGPGSG